MFSIDNNGCAKSVIEKKLSGDVGVSQNLQKLYYPNGGIYATRKIALLEQDAIICNKTGIHLMPLESSVDI